MSALLSLHNQLLAHPAGHPQIITTHAAGIGQVAHQHQLSTNTALSTPHAGLVGNPHHVAPDDDSLNKFFAADNTLFQQMQRRAQQVQCDLEIRHALEEAFRHIIDAKQMYMEPVAMQRLKKDLTDLAAEHLASGQPIANLHHKIAQYKQKAHHLPHLLHPHEAGSEHHASESPHSHNHTHDHTTPQHAHGHDHASPHGHIITNGHHLHGHVSENGPHFHVHGSGNHTN